MAKQTFTTGQVLLASQLTSLQQTAMLGGAASNKTSSYTLVAADAGTAISMTSTSATTITVNTGLFAAGDTVQITNLSTGVATITAGTATVNTSASLALAQYESGTLDFTSTSAAIFIKGAGAAGATGDNYTLLNSGGTTLSGAATRTVSGITGINSLYIYINDASSVSASSDFNLRLNTDTASNYKFFGLNLKNNSDVVFRVDSPSATSVTLANIGNAGGTANILIKIDGTNAAGVKPINVASAGTDTNGESRIMNAIYTGTSAISSVSLNSSVGNFDGGTIFVYGA